MKVETLIIDKVPFDKVIEKRKKATIYFDQFLVGFYGNSAIEAMAHGIPVAAWIRPDIQLDDCPVITADKDVDTWVEMVYNILNDSMILESIDSQLWCKNKHSYQAVAEQWNGIYEIVTI